MMTSRHVRLLWIGLGAFLSCSEPSESVEEGRGAVDEPEREDSAPSDRRRCADDRSWVQVSAGEIQTCGLHGDGCIECWGGSDQSGDLNLPDSGERLDWVDYGDDEPPDGTFVHVSISQMGSGSDHGCALDTLGRVSCWGRDDFGQSSPPGGAFTSLSVNAYYTCGIRADTSIACWGRWERSAYTPVGIGFVRVQVGSSGKVCAVHESGYVACWDGDERYLDRVGTFDAVAVTYRACASGVEAPMDCWGLASGESFVLDSVPAGPGIKDICMAEAPLNSVCALSLDGRVTCSSGHLAEAPETLFTQISCGAQHACGVTSDGRVECWGNCADGECSPPR